MPICLVMAHGVFGTSCGSKATGHAESGSAVEAKEDAGRAEPGLTLDAGEAPTYQDEPRAPCATDWEFTTSGDANPSPTKCEAEALDALRPADSRECDPEWVLQQLLGPQAVDCTREAMGDERLRACIQAALELGRGAFSRVDFLGIDTQTTSWRCVRPDGTVARITFDRLNPERYVYVSTCSRVLEWPSAECEPKSELICVRAYRLADACGVEPGLECPWTAPVLDAGAGVGGACETAAHCETGLYCDLDSRTCSE